MTNYVYSVSMIGDANHVDSINSLGEALGHGTPSLSVPLSADGSEPATHYGGHAVAAQSFIDTLAAGAQGVVPPELQDAGYTGEQVSELLSHLSTSVQDVNSNPLENFLSLADGLGVQRVSAE